MKKLYALFFFFLPVFTQAQTTVLNETFDDGNFSDDPAWSGDISEFIIIAVSGNNQLRLNDTDDSNTTSYMSTESGAAYGSWEFFIDQDFSPSNSNRAYIFLISDREDITSGVNGYAIRAGASGADDRFRLFRIDNGSETEILTGQLDLSSGGPFQIRVTRTESGEWELFEAGGYGSTPTSSAKATDNTHTSTAYFGFRADYTSTRSENFYFDDIIINNSEEFALSSASGSSNQTVEVIFNYKINNATIDTANFSLSGVGKPEQTELIDSNYGVKLTFAQNISDGDYTVTVNNVENIYGGEIQANAKIDLSFSNPFTISSASSPNANEVLLEFSEDVDFSTVSPGDFMLNDSTTPGNVSQPESNQTLLEFDDPIPGGVVEIMAQDVLSTTGWSLPANTTITFTVYEAFANGDVIINEFMKDPPSGTAEYVELKNNTSKYLNLKDWEIGDSNSLSTLSSQDFTLLPDSFVVISADTNTLRSYYGSVHYLQASLPALNNGEDQIRLFDSGETLVDSLQYNSDWGGVDVALERRDASVPSIYSENWGDSPSDDFGTPGTVNQIQPDETAPTISELIIQNDHTLVMAVTERLEHSSAETISNYVLSQQPEDETSTPTPTLPGISSVTQIAADSLQLDLDDNLEEYDGSWTLTANNLTDIFGNVGNDEIEFNYYAIFTAEKGQVVINEFMYDPAPQLSEFVELYNHSDSSFDLQSWTLNDLTGTERILTRESFVLPAGDLVILAPDSTIIQKYPDALFMDMASRFPALNNGTDAIVIKNQYGVQIDSLTYISDWGGSEVSLERISAEAPSFYRENWADSPSDDHATPGTANQVELDKVPPQILNMSYFSADSLYVLFDERVDSTLSSNPGAYSISPSISIAEITEYTGNSLILLLETPLQDGITYTVTVKDQQDIFGNVLESASVDLVYVLISPATEHKVIINEILYRRATANSEEFVELFNRTSQNFDLSGWTFSDATSSATIPDGTRILSGEYLIFTDSKPSESEKNDQPGKSSNNFTSIYLSGFPSLNDDADAVVIKNKENLVIDSLFYHETWGGDQPGRSLERKDPESASNDASNWATNISDSGHSAGTQSSVFQTDVTAPEIIFAKLQASGKIFVAFSEFVKLEHTEVLVNDEPIAIIQHDETAGNIAILGGEIFPAGEPLEVSFSFVTDFRGNANESLSIEVSQPLAPGNVVINEILYDPLADSDDNLPDQTEYIELYNRSEYAISLEGFFLHDEPDENHEIRSIAPVSSQFKWVPSGEYALVYAEGEATIFAESQLAEYFEMENEDDQFYIRIDRSSLSLASSDDAIYLSDSTGTTIDSVFFDESWQNPNLFDTDGVALERIDPDGPGNDESNWSSSTRVNGGTPGEQNSIFQQAGASPEETGITFTPNPFSPDDDGFDDNLFINYKLDEPDYLLRVRIFDRYGREVRKLTDGKQAGFEGSLIWDGLTDSKQKNRVGIYIVLFEAYNSANGKNKTFKETVVLARKF